MGSEEKTNQTAATEELSHAFGTFNDDYFVRVLADYEQNILHSIIILHLLPNLYY